jgi:hypothetical protein
MPVLQLVICFVARCFAELTPDAIEYQILRLATPSTQQMAELRYNEILAPTPDGTPNLGIA